MARNLESEFNEELYRSTYMDLTTMDDEQLRAHYVEYGKDEGRIAAFSSMRENFITYLKNEESVLEIGPFYCPVMTGGHVRYFDVLTKDQLIARATGLGLPTKDVPEIHFCSPNGDLSVVDDKFTAVVSSHCIEHQPDLIEHINQVSKCLLDGGRYYLMVPNKRFCFDSLLTESNLAEVLQANLEQRKVHTLASVIEHRALTTHNDPALHWANDNGSVGTPEEVAAKTKLAIQEYNDAQGGYVDVHAWQFTPDSFRDIFEALYSLEKIDMKIERVYQSPLGRNEFTAVLQKN